MSRFASHLFFPAILGLMTVNAPAADVDEVNGGYYLLHKLCNDESKLPLLLTVKTAPEELHAFADDISRTAKETLHVLDRFHDTDRSIDFDKNPLPKIERDVREAITGEKQHQLLFQASGPEFARALLTSQIEGTTYAENMAKVLAEQETDPDRRVALRNIAAKWKVLHERSFALLGHY